MIYPFVWRMRNAAYTQRRTIVSYRTDVIERMHVDIQFQVGQPVTRLHDGQADARRQYSSKDLALLVYKRRRRQIACSEQIRLESAADPRQIEAIYNDIHLHALSLIPTIRRQARSQLYSYLWGLPSLPFPSPIFLSFASPPFPSPFPLNPARGSGSCREIAVSLAGQSGPGRAHSTNNIIFLANFQFKMNRLTMTRT